MTGRHPSFEPGNVTVVVERATGAIVSCLHVISQRWAYGGVPIPVAQPELIGTRTEYRGKGLVRAQFEAIHAWSAERGDRLLAIAGVPWFYRQFGYEMAIERGGGPVVHIDYPLAPPPAGWRLRPATTDDAPVLARLGAEAAKRMLLSVPRDTALWRYELEGKAPDNAARREIRMLERDGVPVGYLVHFIALFGPILGSVAFEVTAGASWREAWMTALPYLLETGQRLAKETPDGRFAAAGFWFLGRDHPLYRAARFKEWDLPYAWYARVPDLPAFLRDVAPALEQRLAASPCAGHSGTLTLGFYRDGVRLVLERGALTKVDAWRPDMGVHGVDFGRASKDPRRPLAMFPDLTFLQLLFGYRSLAELEGAFPDCVVRTPEAHALLDALFPRMPSDVWPVV